MSFQPYYAKCKPDNLIILVTKEKEFNLCGYTVESGTTEYYDKHEYHTTWVKDMFVKMEEYPEPVKKEITHCTSCGNQKAILIERPDKNGKVDRFCQSCVNERLDQLDKITKTLANIMDI